jgi:hypothetical protein
MKNTTLIITKSKDAEKRDSLTIEIDDKGVFIPSSIIEDFLKSNHRNIQVTIPD